MKHNGLDDAFVFSQPKDTVAKKSEHNEEDRESHALVDSALRLDAIIHHHVPVLARQDLTHTHTHNKAMTEPLETHSVI